MNPLSSKEYPGPGHEDIPACLRYAQEIIRDERVSAPPRQGKSTGYDPAGT